MHIPAYARDTIRAALPSIPTSRHVGGLNCCLCDELFGEDLAAIPLGPTPTSGLFGCRPCLTRLVARARRARDAALTQDAERARAESEAWLPVRERHLARLDGVRQAAEAVAGLAEDGDTEVLRVAWLLVSLESAYTWVPDAPEPPHSVDSDDSDLRDETFRLSLAMIAAREAVAERLAYHLINEAQPEEPEMCGEFECPEGCSGRHDSSHIDCGPDGIFDDLTTHGVVVERPDLTPTPGRRHSPITTVTEGGVEAEAESSDTGEEPAQSVTREQFVTVLKHVGIDTEDTEVLVSAAAVGLVSDAWRDSPLDAIHAAAGGPSDGEIFAQSVDLYRRARTSLIAAREDGPEALLAFQAVASDIHLRWAGGSRFTLGSSGEPTEEFVQHVDDRVWYTSELMREHGWQHALLYRATSAVFKASTHFGMPGWPTVVAAAMERLTALDRSSAPEALGDLAEVEAALLEAPDRLGAHALDWLSGQIPFG
ncbi:MULTISPECIES: hypothetical protein [unclassified Streptomyces]|uniref:hypothetical protein n=1 Tax=unclassified Streptomyces TaxID=2593676 RepID=UPI002E2B9EBD|nr:hypothetical protein [Streptomyces sp. NBC_00223]